MAQTPKNIYPKAKLLAPLLLILAFLMQACGTGLLGSAQPTATLPYPTPAPTQTLPEATIEFHVQLPANTPLREPVYLNLLDEVTGLGLNVKRMEMQPEDDLNYTVSLRFPVGATIKYRYARQGTYLAEEHTANKRPVRYRLFHVEGPGVIHDVVSAWSDTAFDGPTGRIKGTATDSETGAPIPNLLIGAGGYQTFTASDGSFLIEGLPPGTQNLVAYAMDGSYRTFQQGAVIAPESTTPTPIQLVPAPLVNVVFTVIVPRDTMPAVPVRLAGNLYQLGNTFANLAGGVSELASRMPSLSPLPDGRYSLTLALPAGADVRYKYTLGDGFWNAEHSANGEFRVRRLIVPESPAVVEDSVDSWGGGARGPVLFDLRVPDETPTTDSVSIQFNPYGWTEPIPMWFLGENHWAYILYGPLEILDRFGYRYCRDDQCGSADDSATPGNDSFGRVLEPKEGPQTVKEQVKSWIWLDPNLPPASITTTEVRDRGDGFFAGVELKDAFHPSWIPRLPVTLKEIQSMGANWVVLASTWTYTQISPPVLEPVAGSDALWSDSADATQRAHAFGLNVALHPTPQFPGDPAEWWASAPRDFPWWQNWFERYTQFALHFADLAQRQGAQALTLGGDWIAPALPGGRLIGDQPSGVPADAESRWRDLLEQVRAHYSGRLIWSMTFPDGVKDPPAFLDAVDQVYLIWNDVPLAEVNDAAEADLHATAAGFMDNEIKSFQANLNKPVIIAVAYPSADGGITGCIPDPLATTKGACLKLESLSRPNPDIPTVILDLEEQEQVYNALLVALNEREWIGGFVTRGFYPPAPLQDKSISVHGKPAEDVLWYWYPRLLGKLSP
ncbi:MAG TPA: hypothetical protein VE136_05500 [Anaerolineales bacterium]|nr:hypothetical protein [Anaerolineales bacterium]